MTRIDRARAALTEASIDALIVSNASNVRYLTGFCGSNGTLVLTADGATLLTDRRYDERAHDEVAAAGAEVDITIAPGNARPEVLDLLTEAHKVGIEEASVTWSDARSLIDDLGVDRVVPTNSIVERLRETKDAYELELMTQAATIADSALTSVLDDIRPGPTERQLAQRLDQLVLDGGADGRGFETIVASGPNAARPHHQATDRQLASGDLVIIDFGAEYGGYRSDMTRTFVLGRPTDRQRILLDGVQASQEAGVAAVDIGVAASSIDDACRSHLHEIGLGEWFTHGTGHGVGLDIHEAPSVSAKSTATLAAGHVITVEPGVYVPDFGGVRWEDTVVVTAHGAEPLTRSAKQPVVD